MSPTPVKTNSRLTPRSKSATNVTHKTPSKLSTYESRGIIYTPQEALDLLMGLSSNSSSDEDEEWIVTKPKPNVVPRSLSVDYNDDKVVQSTRSKEKVSPLKLLRRPEYEVNKLPSSCKKSDEAVSPIIIKRKTENHKNESYAVSPLTPSTRNNVASTSNTLSPRRSQRKKSLKKENAENELIASVSTPDKKGEITDSEVKTKRGRKPKEKRKNVELELSFEDKISALSIQDTPKKSTVGGSSPEGMDEDIQEDENTFILQKVEQKVQTTTTNCMYIKSPHHSVCAEEEVVESDAFTYRRTPRRTCSKKVNLSESDEEFECGPSPPKRRYRRKTNTQATRSARKSMKDTPSKTKGGSDWELSSPEKKTPKRSLRAQGSAVDSPSLLRHVLTPRGSARNKLDLASPSTSKETPNSTSLARQVLTPRVSSARKKLDLCSIPGSAKKVSCSALTPLAPERSRNSILPTTPLDEVRVKLHTGIVPEYLPCREKEFKTILSFISRKIVHGAGGCMYISGVPGTGKTATVSAAVRTLEREAERGEIPKFTYVPLNGLQMAEPRAAYVRIWQGIAGEKLTGEQAMHALEKKFNGENKKPCVILLDELDYLCNRRQDVIYNILEWATKSSSALTVLTIANTMDLPERTLKGKVTSRMGLTRVVFQPYTFQQLQEIVKDRVCDNPCFHPDAVQFVARKVAAVNGDARRALDICRRATETVSGDEIITVNHINEVIERIYCGHRVQAIRNLGEVSKLLLRAMADEYKKRGTEEMTICHIHSEMVSISAFEGKGSPLFYSTLAAATELAESGLILAESSRSDLNRKLSLNVSAEDVHFALADKPKD